MISIVDKTTLAKNRFSVSALSSGFVALELSGFVKVGMPCLNLNLERAYFQNLLGLSFTLAAMLRWKSPQGTLFRSRR